MTTLEHRLRRRKPVKSNVKQNRTRLVLVFWFSFTKSFFSQIYTGPQKDAVITTFSLCNLPYLVILSLSLSLFSVIVHIFHIYCVLYKLKYLIYIPLVSINFKVFHVRYQLFPFKISNYYLLLIVVDLSYFYSTFSA